MPQAAGYRDEGMFGSVETVGAAGVFGQVMGLVAVTLFFFTLGAYLGRKSRGCVDHLLHRRLRLHHRPELRPALGALSITMLFAAGLLLGSGWAAC